MPRSPRSLALVALALALAGCAASLGEAHPCPETPCGDGRTCVAGRCRAPEAPASPSDALRLVLPPRDLAVVALRGGGGGPDLPDAVALGSAENGTVVMLFRFDTAWRDDAEVQSAFLVLEALDGAPPAVNPIQFEMARVVEPWRADAVSWGRQPRLGVPFTAGSVRARPPIPLRVDVTPIVRTWARRDADDHGLALLARGDDPLGVVISLGVTQGRGPRLEVYVK